MGERLVLERDIEERLKKRVKAYGGKYIKFFSSSETGLPDRIVVLPGGKVLFVELKRPTGGRLSQMQRYQIEQLRDLGCTAEVVKNYDEIETLLRKAAEHD